MQNMGRCVHVSCLVFVTFLLVFQDCLFLGLFHGVKAFKWTANDCSYKAAYHGRFNGSRVFTCFGRKKKSEANVDNDFKSLLESTNIETVAVEERPVDRPNRELESIFSSSSYSLTRPGEKLPPGCKNILDFMQYARNYDFKTACSIEEGKSGGGDTTRGIIPKVPDYVGPFSDSAYGLAFPDESDAGADADKIKKVGIGGSKLGVDLGELYKELASKPIPATEQSQQSGEDIIRRINPNYFMYDTMGYLQNYLKNLNVFNWQLYGQGTKCSTDNINYYLNHDYTQKIPKPFPPSDGHTEMVREYLMGEIPGLMDLLVDMIRNDPNRFNTPSPPLHEMELAPGFKTPDYWAEEWDGTRPEGGYTMSDYEKYASLEGLHDPNNMLFFPYANRQPLYQRKLLAILVEIQKSGDLGPVVKYRKGATQRRRIVEETFPELLKIHDTPKHESASEVADKSNYPKLYETGKRKRALALVYLEPGNGHLIINGRDGYQYLKYQEEYLHDALLPLSCVYLYNKFNVVAMVRGGGHSGQAGAIRHALSRYIYRILAPKLKHVLRIQGMVTIDRRKVERKKTSKRKARKVEKYTKR